MKIFLKLSNELVFEICGKEFLYLNIKLNQILELEIKRPEQVWVSDITYIGKRENLYYLSLATDAYSKKIMGFNLANNMNTQSSLIALENAIKRRKDQT